MRERGSGENDRRRPIASSGGWCTGARGELSNPMKIVYTKFMDEDPEVVCEMLSPSDTCEGTTVTPDPTCIFFEKIVYEPQERESLSCDFPFGTHQLVYDSETGIIEASPLLPEGHEPIQLPHAEGIILETLLENPGKIFTQRQLFDRYAGQDLVTSRTVDAHIARLRKRLGQRMVGDDKTPEIIKTRKNIGYYIPRSPRDGSAK